MGVNDRLLLPITPHWDIGHRLVSLSLFYHVRVSPAAPVCGLSSLHLSRDLDAKCFVACPSFFFPGGSIYGLVFRCWLLVYVECCLAISSSVG
jgi:hypothetical protein